MDSIRVTVRIAVCAFVIVGCLWGGPSFPPAEEALGAEGIPPDKVADYIHAILEANRTIYTTSIVNRLQEKGLLSATEHWEQDNTLPLPAQFLQHTGRIVAESGRGIRFRLIGLSPIYQRNAPATQFERQALETLRKRPEQPVTGIVTSGKKRYFQAIYADRAVSPVCVSCHNTHPLSPKQDFKLNDVMGAIAITIPLE
ncbi:MAG: DUF3365 domain-containing protein [Nitrospira sp.]|nr:DUF3365 domain-containing protein [Nitrospira sp.]